MTSEYIEFTKGRIIQAKVSATFGYVIAMGASIGAVVSDLPVSYIVLTAFGISAAVVNGVMADKLESRVKAAEGLEAKL